jgi:hypothetical protein
MVSGHRRIWWLPGGSANLTVEPQTDRAILQRGLMTFLNASVTIREDSPAPYRLTMEFLLIPESHL